jgi:hypothetical protein
LVKPTTRRERFVNTYLIAHTATPKSKDIAQASVRAKSEATARNTFKRARPERTIQLVGVRGRS